MHLLPRLSHKFTKGTVRGTVKELKVEIGTCVIIILNPTILVHCPYSVIPYTFYHFIKC